MKKAAVTGLLLVLLIATLTSASDRSPSERAAPADTPKFKSYSQLVVVPVVVLHDGTPVTGLTKDKFKVYEDGKEQRISYFEEIKADLSPATATRHNDAVQDSFSNTQVERSTPKQLVIIALDLINTQFEDSYYARQELIKFLSKNVDEGALISLVAIGQHGVKVVHDFTSEPQVLVAALKKVGHNGDQSGLASPGTPQLDLAKFEGEVKTLTTFLESGRFPGAASLDWSSAQQETWFKIRQTLDALNLIAQAYAGVPGRKSLIWATGGFPFQIDSYSMSVYGFGYAGAGFNDLIGYYERTWRVMNQANVAMYPVDVRGLTVDSVDASQDVDFRHAIEVVRKRSTDNLDRIATLQTFAAMTGGRAFYNSNDVAGGFRKAAADSASYYLLSYYMDRAKANEKKSRWHKLKVTVDARAAEIRARSGFFSGEDTPGAVKNEIALALTSPLDFTALPVTVRWLQQSSTDSTRTISRQGVVETKSFGFEVFVPPNSIVIDENDANRLSVEVVTSARTEQGKDVNGVVQKIDGRMKKDSVEQIRSHGFVYKGSISLPPGNYSVRFVVRDNVGQRTGSVAAPLKVN